MPNKNLVMNALNLHFSDSSICETNPNKLVSHRFSCPNIRCFKIQLCLTR